jgi:hypothetical protein
MGSSVVHALPISLIYGALDKKQFQNRGISEKNVYSMRGSMKVMLVFSQKLTTIIVKFTCIMGPTLRCTIIYVNLIIIVSFEKK